MYGREYQGKALNFEASGGLLHSSLIMQDKETDSYWSIMSGDSLSGKYKGTTLRELPLGEKVQWKDWVAAHPNTLVLSVEGVEHDDNNPYDNYFSSDSGFRGVEATDTRLATKQPIYSFHLKGKPYAVPFTAFEDGGVVQVGKRQLFLYRPAGVEIFYSTFAFLGEGFKRDGERWIDTASGAAFDAEAGQFVGGDGAKVERLDGFDTFWFNWSMANPKTEVLTH